MEVKHFISNSFLKYMLCIGDMAIFLKEKIQLESQNPSILFRTTEEPVLNKAILSSDSQRKITTNSSTAIRVKKNYNAMNTEETDRMSSSTH